MHHFADLVSNHAADDRTCDYMLMSLIRQFETKLLDLFSQGLLSGTTHTCIGQEANAIALMAAIDKDIDTVWSNHRCHGHFLAYCGEVHRLFAEIVGRASGVCGGRGGSQHLAWRNFFSSGIQGGLVPLAVGTALADRDKGAITNVFLGDGTMGEGYVYEGLNLASLWDCPVLFVVEDNGIAQTTPRDRGVAGRIAERARPFDIESASVRSTDLAVLKPAAQEAARYVRERGRPFWLHIETVRLRAHSKSDDTRSEAELEALRELDCLDLLRAGMNGETDLLDTEVAAYLDACFDAAMKDPEPCA
ncbi:thiamine pyrophosphate-dependent dehydrogenase E1 component subunit alpha [Stakelama saccharophila]|uniref:Thiamine pyrophosphate-dependent dehydrogenase E1 component subunit alpha n=1 Tax=Stakelama saccharophila TaxID=3075605 RepID=A0ABZ0BA98_9SPHN|nr:thiamine pyrophosphate-dependent dehydrogenase E1 component subunit alpha [Stakelama sp. W311]WNO54192.1 thiamine pyrophosphate-dependent dehydrogenase E1 component subunit alpha [Stakelama sp. W311]